MTKRVPLLLLTALLAGAAACDHEENDANESARERNEAARSGSDDAAEGDGTDGIR